MKTKESYISIHGKKTKLTDEQLIELGFEVYDTKVKEFIDIIRSGKTRKHYSANDIITLCGMEFKIIGIDHDGKNTVTLMGCELLKPRRMNNGGCENGWAETELRKWLHEYFEKEYTGGIIDFNIG